MLVDLRGVKVELQVWSPSCVPILVPTLEKFGRHR